MTERWFIAKVFYSLADLKSEDDPNGDMILVEFARPAREYIDAQGWSRWCTVMRFSEEGYHIRFMVYGDEQVLATKVEPYVRQAIERHRAEHAEVFQQPMQLALLAERLNRKWGGPKDTFQLRRPDTTMMGLMYNTGEDEIFESQAAFDAHYDLHSDSCKRVLDFLADNPSMKLRKTFVRVLLDDFLRLTDLNERERYYFLTYLRLQWVQYFDLDEATLAPYHMFYKEMEPRYRKYFSRKKSPEDSLALLPQQLHGPYMAWIAAIQQGLKAAALVGRADHGALTAHGGLRLLSFFHLTHNRIGIGMLQEIYLAYLLAQHYRSFLTAQEIAVAEEWAMAMQSLDQGKIASVSAASEAL